MIETLALLGSALALMIWALVAILDVVDRHRPRF